jgi:hypothetical protein
MGSVEVGCWEKVVEVVGSGRWNWRSGSGTKDLGHLGFSAWLVTG